MMKWDFQKSRRGKDNEQLRKNQEYEHLWNPPRKVRFTLGMTSEPEKVMLFEIKSITVVDGTNSDLAIDALVYNIELGSRLE